MSLYSKTIKDENIARAPSNLANNRIPDTHKATLKLASLYSNASSGLSATDLQGAIDEIDSSVDTLQSEMLVEQSNVDTLQAEMLVEQSNVDALQALDAAAASGAGFRKLYAKAIVDMDEVTLGSDYVVDVNIPDNAIITNAWIDVTTTVAGDVDDTLTIGVGVETVSAGSEDLVNAIAVSDGSNVWDAGIQACIPVGTAATAIKLTAERDITVVTVANGNASATGAFDVYVEYVLGE